MLEKIDSFENLMNELFNLTFSPEEFFKNISHEETIKLRIELLAALHTFINYTIRDKNKMFDLRQQLSLLDLDMRLANNERVD